MSYTVFLDRDGVINFDSPEYIKSRSEFKFIPGSCEAIALLCRRGFDVIVITNQSVIGRKMVTPDTLDAIFGKMKEAVENAGGEIRDIFFCPHMPGDGCSCRKPLPGLILQARDRHDIDLDFSCMVGDSAKDIECGINAGCSKTLLVKTGSGREAEKTLLKRRIKPDFTGSDLYEISQWIVNNLIV